METRRAMLIAGRWVETGTTSPIRNPYNGAVLAEVCLAGEAEADEAIRAAVSAFAVSRKLPARSEEHTSELQSRLHLVCRLLLEKKKKTETERITSLSIRAKMFAE